MENLGKSVYLIDCIYITDPRDICDYFFERRRRSSCVIFVEGGEIDFWKVDGRG